MLNQPRAATRAQARQIVQTTLRRDLQALPAEDREIAAAHAIGGYLEEHIARGGSVVGD